MRHFVVVTLGIALIAGCGRDKQPVMSHGQPVSHWVEALKDPDPGKRKQAVRALGHVGAADSATIPAVTDALKDSNARVRAEAALALLNIGPPAKDAVPDLEKAQNDKDATVRCYAQKALERIRR
jgi:HEAT repeat protein